MRRILRCVGLTLALEFLPTAFAQDKNPDPTDKPNPTDKPMAVDKNAPRPRKKPSTRCTSAERSAAS